MNDQTLKALCDEISKEETKLHGVKATPHTGKLLDVVSWLRQHGVTLLTIFTNLQNVWTILQDGTLDLATKLQRIYDIFKQYLPANTPVIQLP